MKDSFKKTIELILLFGLMAFIGYSITSSGFLDKIEFDTPFEKNLSIIGVFVIVHLVLVVHELGHLLVGLFQGFRFEMFVVGFLGVKREEEKVKFYFNKNLAHYGGIAATTPVDDSKENAKKFAYILLAGPIASLVFALVCFAFTFSPNPLVQFISFFGALTSIGIFLATTVPSKTGVFFTDRKRFQRLVQPGKDREVELAILNVMGKYGKENSYKNVNKKDIELLSSDEDPLIKLIGLSTAICHQLENNGHANEETLSQYDFAKEGVSKSFAKAMDIELEKFKQKINV